MQPHLLLLSLLFSSSSDFYIFSSQAVFFTSSAKPKISILGFFFIWQSSSSETCWCLDGMIINPNSMTGDSESPVSRRESFQMRSFRFKSSIIITLKLFFASHCSRTKPGFILNVLHCLHCSHCSRSRLFILLLSYFHHQAALLSLVSREVRVLALVSESSSKFMHHFLEDDAVDVLERNKNGRGDFFSY